MRANSKCHRVESSDVIPPPSSSIGDTMTEELIDHAADAVAVDVPPPPPLDDSDIRRMLEIVMTVQVAHGHILVDMLDELHAL